MSVHSKLKRAVAIAPSLHRILAPAQYLLIMSHMRSRSTLLSHILGSHEQICGYSEQHRSYESPTALLRLKADLLKISGKKRPAFYLDKLLHNQHELSEKILNSTRVKPVFLIREPRSTLQSMLQLGNDHGTVHCSTPQEACEYYCARLTRLEDLAQRRTGEFFFINSDQLIEQPEPLLDALRIWLGLEHPLRTNYSLFDHTGHSGHGDSSGSIQTGTIQTKKTTHNFTIQDRILDQAQAKYEAHCSRMSKKGICIL